MTLRFSARGAFRAKVNSKTRNASRVLNKAEPSSPDADGRVFENEEQLLSKRGK